MREGRFWDYMFEASTGYAVFIEIVILAHPVNDVSLLIV